MNEQLTNPYDKSRLRINRKIHTFYRIVHNLEKLINR